MSLTRKPLGSHHRIVIKIGSALLVDRKSGLKKDWLDAICEDIAALKKNGADVQVVSSGAIALGRTVLGLPSGALKLEKARRRRLSARLRWRGHGRKACRGMTLLPARFC